MFASETYEQILSRMLSVVKANDGNLDMREGSVVWYGDAPAAIEFTNLYIALDTILKETFADTASRQYLIRRAAERGLAPQEASYATLELTTTPATLELGMGERFSIGDLNYAVTSKVSDGVYQITCETAGASGNDYSGICIPIEYIKGLETCTVTALLIPGEDDEDTEIFRQRYFDSLNAQAFGGNKRDYIDKVNAIQGVGGCKIYRAWNGDIVPASLIPPDSVAVWIAALTDVPDAVKEWLDAVYTAGASKQLTVGGTVKVVIIDSTYSEPSSTLVDLVQTTVDPEQNAGEGLGTAPIGHVVNVIGVVADTINITFTLTYKTGWSWDSVEAAAQKAIKVYFTELAKNWASNENALVVRTAQIESRMLAITGIEDISGTTINDDVANLTLPIDHIPALGTITAS